jgi:23S rRNA (cytidine1920-2'-O)/16S rRNA (cytidine1409-2'-O)-methyltransferase
VLQVGRGGVVRDPDVRKGTVVEVLRAAATLGYGCAGLVRSPITGPAGNVEFLAYLTAMPTLPIQLLCDAVDFA